MRVVTVQHFGSFKPYTFLVDFAVKPHDILVADSAKESQLVCALTSDYEIKDEDASKVVGVRPFKKIISKVENTCYCNGTRASEIPMPSMALKPVTYFCSRRWVGVDEDLPKDHIIVLTRTQNGDLYLAFRKGGEWVDAYIGKIFKREVKEWLNIDLNIYDMTKGVLE